MNVVIIYHLTTPEGWHDSPGNDYRAQSLLTEGFIHCSRTNQVARVANLFYANVPDLVVLHIDTGRLVSPWKEESGGGEELFPHIYGEINRSAVTAVTPLRRAQDGQWAFP